MTYDEALAYISNMQGRGWRLGLDRMKAFVHRLGLGESLGAGKRPKFIHVAGTNGKGSVTAYSQAILTAAGFRTGGYFSPYVYDIRERVQIDCKPIGREFLADLVTRMQPIADGFEGSEFGEITEFEFKTALGFLFWAERECDWVALEVGLGGRLDATNVVTPSVSVITSIGLDHTEILGDTEAAIAKEKAGIIKPGRPVLVGDVGEEALAEIASIAAAHEAPMLHCPRSSEPIAQYNAKLARLAIGMAGVEVSEELAMDALNGLSLPGRFQRHNYLGTDFVLDGAHNPASARVLAESLLRDFPKRRMILLTGMLGGHDPTPYYNELRGLFDSVIVSSIDFHRAIDTWELESFIRPIVSSCEVRAGVNEAVERSVALAKNDGIVVVSGSFYLVGEVGRFIGADKPFSAP